MSKAKIMELLGLDESDFEPKDRIAELEAKLQALTEFQGLTVRDMGNGVFEVVKDTDKPSGDYTNPIRYVQGASVEVGKFYTDGSDIWEAVKEGTPSGFDDAEYFEIIR